ncbi:MAG: LPS assembly protein LptD [Proteobacteria bacterium]|nr:LPS assembly protein LptD [Pseudomonadota bacterium]
MALLRSLLLAAFVAPVMVLSPLQAQTLVREFEAEEAGKNVVMNADSLTYDENHGTVTASGNVEVSQGHRLLIADTVSYNEGQDMMTASGNVTLMEPSGEVLFADYLELSDEMRDGVLRNIRLLLDEDTRIAANSARRSDGNRTEMSKAVFSPCKLCPLHPEEAPLWQIKAVRVVHDQEARDIAYYDAWLEMFGIPVLYTPYFEHPDPTVQRRSGLLAPTYGSSSTLGFQLTTPYYWNIAPNRDATFKPKFTSDEGVVWGAEYRARTLAGNYSVDASINYGDERDDDGIRTGNSGFRGHLFSDGRFELDPVWNYGYEFERASDDTYLSFYRIDSKDTLTTRPYIEGINGRNYASGNAYFFQGLEIDDDQEQIPFVLPLLDFNHRGAPGAYGAFNTFDANFMTLHRIDGADSRRLSLEGGWHLPHIGRSGSVYRLSATLRGDAYHVNNVDNAGTARATNARGFTGRLRPELIAEWRLPLVRDSGGIQQLVEPIVQGILSPYGGNPGEIPNEDSQDFEFDDSKLFSNNRFTGLDRVESGPRVNYGLRFGFFGAGSGRTQGMIGQSARLKEDDTFNRGSGLEDTFSDYVGRIHISPADIFDLAYRFRLSKENLAARRNEIDFAAGPRAFRVNVGYALLEKQIPESDTTAFANREEIAASAAARITSFWRVSAGTRRDLTGSGGTINWNGAVTYEDECLLFTTSLIKNFTRDRDVQPETSLLFTIQFKHLG